MTEDQADDVAGSDDLDVDALFPVADLPTGGPGPVERGLQSAVEEAKRVGQLQAIDAAAVAGALAGARALDQAGTGSGPKVAYAVAAVLTPYREFLTACGLTRDRVETPASGAAGFLAGLAIPTGGDPP